jgi:hypothetical protein
MRSCSAPITVTAIQMLLPSSCTNNSLHLETACQVRKCKVNPDFSAVLQPCSPDVRLLLWLEHCRRHRSRLPSTHDPVGVPSVGFPKVPGNRRFPHAGRALRAHLLTTKTLSPCMSVCMISTLLIPSLLAVPGNEMMPPQLQPLILHLCISHYSSLWTAWCSVRICIALLGLV